MKSDKYTWSSMRYEDEISQCAAKKSGLSLNEVACMKFVRFCSSEMILTSAGTCRNEVRHIVYWQSAIPCGNSTETEMCGHQKRWNRKETQRGRRPKLVKNCTFKKNEIFALLETNGRADVNQKRLPLSTLCYFMWNERHVVLLRVSDEFQVCLKKSH